MEQPQLEEIASGEFAAGAIAQVYPALFADVIDVFMALDPREITKKVLDHRQTDMVYVIEALDDAYGEVVDPYADEDDA